jgi:tetratricopeptide (TPR) repeat protein
LSVHIAHLLRGAYPDGQIFIGCNGGTDQDGELLGRVLRALGVQDVHRLRTVDDRVAGYRAAISRKRVLIVLDNVASAEEVRPLVPGVTGTALLVSSRARLTTLTAEHVDLRLFDREESITLLRRIVGDARVAADPAAAGEVATMCGGLPLAVRIVAARLAAHRHWRMSRLLDRMRDERRRLDEMSADGLAVRISVTVSYEAVPAAARRAFRLLGFLAVPVFGEWLVAALVGGSIDDADELLEQLFDARLVDVVEAPSRQSLRYQMHDLVRLYAYERAVEEDAPEDLRAAVERALTAATELVERLCEPLPYAIPRLYRRSLGSIELDPSVVNIEGHHPEWLSAEADAMVVTVERAASLGMDDGACSLADALVYAAFALHNNFDGWNRAHAAAHAAARRAGNRAAEAVMECGTGLLRYKEDRFAEAERHFGRAIELFDAADHDHGRAAASSGLGTVFREVGRHREAVPLLERALPGLERVGDRDGAAHASYGLGCAHRELGNDDTAVEYLQQAANLYRSTGHWRGEAIAIRGIGLVHRARGELDEAGPKFVRAHEMVIERDDPLLACYTTQSLAKLWIRQGHHERAREPLYRSLSVCLEAQDRLGAALMRRTIGEMYLAAGQVDRALRDLNLALAAWTQLDHELGQARTLRDIGAAHARSDDCPAAHRAWQAACGTFVRLGTREAGELAEWARRWGCACELGWLDRRSDDQQPLAGSVM